MMPVSKERLLDALPPEENIWVTLVEDQDVDDIISEVLNSHKRYADYYDLISPFFDVGRAETIASELYRFCKKNITYREEGRKDQTTAVPAGFLSRGYGDCKHFATFCGGVLDSIHRQTGKKIDWCYRFASYDFFDKTPHHVFVVLNPGEANEAWLDPIPKAETKTPFWQIDKKVSMALRTQIAGTSVLEHYTKTNVGAIEKVLPFTGDNLNFDGTHKYANAFGPSYLGLTDYSDFDAGAAITTNWNDVAAQLNEMIGKGPDPTFTVTPDFVKWVFDNSIRSWNFYYHGGVAPGFSAESLLPAGWPHLVITDDGRLTFDHDVKLDDYRNAEIHLLTAWIQSTINDNSSILYPIKPRDVKLFSQNYTGNPGNPAANLFQEHRGSSVFQDIGKGLEKALNMVKADVLKVIGSIPRNAFLGLVGLNVFNMAGNLDKEIQSGKWPDISKKWQNLGGNPDKLQSTINHGKGKKAILGNAIGQEPVTTSTAALLAAAAPILAAMLAFLNKDGKMNGLLTATKAGLNQLFPDQNFDFIDGSLVNTKTGNAVQWTVDPKDNENLGGGNSAMPHTGIMAVIANNKLPVAGAIGLGSYFIINKKKQKKDYILPLVISVASYFIIDIIDKQGTGGGASNSTVAAKDRIDLLTWVTSDTTSNAADKAAAVSVFQKMADSEILDTYDYIFNYFMRGQQLQTTNPLYPRIQAISTKYNIFT